MNFNLNYTASELFPVRRARFLGMSVPVPSDVDAVLERQYGPRFLTSCQGCYSVMRLSNERKLEDSIGCYFKRVKAKLLFKLLRTKGKSVQSTWVHTSINYDKA